MRPELEAAVIRILVTLAVLTAATEWEDMDRAMGQAASQAAADTDQQLCVEHCLKEPKRTEGECIRDYCGQPTMTVHRWVNCMELCEGINL